MAYKNPIELANQILKPQTNRRTLRDLDDFQSYLLPDMNAQEYFDALKNDKEGKVHDSYWKLDTGFRDSVENAILGELGISPSEFHKVLNSKSNPDYIKAYEEWDKGGRKPTKGSWDFNSIYDKDAYLNLYRPKEQWGQADRIHTRDEWESNFDPEGKIHEGFNPYKTGYANARKSWDNFIKQYGSDIINPKYAKILEWLDENKERF